jgi:ABC-type polar amino acid transport system ATPase subunit
MNRNANEFACDHLEKLRAEQRRLDQSPFGLSRGFSLRQRVALASWLCFDRKGLDDLTPVLDEIINGRLMIPGDVIPNVVRDEARRLRKAWEEHKAQSQPEDATELQTG